MAVLSVRALGPLLIGVERACGMRARTHWDVIVGRAARHRRHVVIVIRVVDRLGVGWIVRCIPDGVTVRLWVTGVRIDFVASEDYRP